jgi:hypothetical protein
MPVSVGFRAFRPASWFVTADTDAARNPARFIHTRRLWPIKSQKQRIETLNNSK